LLASKISDTDEVSRVVDPINSWGQEGSTKNASVV